MEVDEDGLKCTGLLGIGMDGANDETIDDIYDDDDLDVDELGLCFMQTERASRPKPALSGDVVNKVCVPFRPLVRLL